MSNSVQISIFKMMFNSVQISIFEMTATCYRVMYSTGIES
jgi:hypothetical protein